MNNGYSLKISTSDEFAESLAKIAIAQICDSVGVQGCQESALDRLRDVMCKYVWEIGKVSCFYANVAGRSESNVFDVVRGLEDLGVSQQGSGLGVVKEIVKFVDVAEEVEFAYEVPEFPVGKERGLRLSFEKAGEMPPVDYVPSWLPCFPDPKTYTGQDLVSVEQTEIAQNTVEQDQKVIELPLMKLEQRAACNGFQVPAFELGGKEQVNNPFLASPLKYGVKKVALVSLPVRLVEEEDVAQSLSLWARDVSALKTVAPLIKGFKSSDLDTVKGNQEDDLKRRPAVKLKFQTSKKSCLGNTDTVSWFANDDSRDDKKRKTEKTLKRSFENVKHTEMMQL